LRTVAVILGNPRYTGRQVWDRQQRSGRRSGSPVHQSMPAGEWAVPARRAPPSLVTEEEFVAAQHVCATRPTRSGQRRQYLLSGLVRCGVCGRRMDSHWIHDRAGYRCRHGHSSSRPRTAAGPKYVYLCRTGPATPRARRASSASGGRTGPTLAPRAVEIERALDAATERAKDAPRFSSFPWLPHPFGCRGRGRRAPIAPASPWRGASGRTGPGRPLVASRSAADGEAGGRTGDSSDRRGGAAMTTASRWGAALPLLCTAACGRVPGTAVCAAGQHAWHLDTGGGCTAGGRSASVAGLVHAAVLAARGRMLVLLAVSLMTCVTVLPDARLRLGRPDIRRPSRQEATYPRGR
jgi:hypothetical protein